MLLLTVIDKRAIKKAGAPFICPIDKGGCGRSYASFNGLKYHIKCHYRDDMKCGRSSNIVCLGSEHSTAITHTASASAIAVSPPAIVKQQQCIEFFNEKIEDSDVTGADCRGDHHGNDNSNGDGNGDSDGGGDGNINHICNSNINNNEQKLNKAQARRLPVNIMQSVLGGDNRGSLKLSSHVPFPDEVMLASGSTRLSTDMELAIVNAKNIIDVAMASQTKAGAVLVAEMESDFSLEEGVAASLPLPVVVVRTIPKDRRHRRLAKPRPESYYRHITSGEDLSSDDDDCTLHEISMRKHKPSSYDMDDVDSAWLLAINKERRDEGVPPVSAGLFELTIEKMEKRSYFLQLIPPSAAASLLSPQEDADCCVCGSGDCEPSNTILFCDACNIAVHQDCYGVPCIPDSQWLCRRCLMSPSTSLRCILCPSSNGGMKQTVDGRWAHVVCASWIPETNFANQALLEPIEGIENIPRGRWKLLCSICKRRGGACVQCSRPNCAVAFHATCALTVRLSMNVEHISGKDDVRRSAYCTLHTPGISNRHTWLKNARIKARSAHHCEQICSFPILPPNRATRLFSRIPLHRPAKFIRAIKSYWTLKRKALHGVPLLQQLRSMHRTPPGHQIIAPREHRCPSSETAVAIGRLRADLENARLLIELVRKREKAKRDWFRCMFEALELQLQPMRVLLLRCLDRLFRFDKQEIFHTPVPVEFVPDYLSVIDKPMDLSTMRNKVDYCEYDCVAAFRDDFELMCNNALVYNMPDTPYYTEARHLLAFGRRAIAIVEQTLSGLNIVGDDDGHMGGFLPMDFRALLGADQNYNNSEESDISCVKEGDLVYSNTVDGRIIEPCVSMEPATESKDIMEESVEHSVTPNESY